jgi:phosphoglycolate phosphatase-like HAD superfamily hydrolase
MFIISGTPEQELATIVERRGITGYFNEVLGSPVSKSAHIAMLLKKYRLQAGSCVFVGDAMTDYEAAMDTGTRFIGIRGENSFPAGTEVLADCRELGPAIASIRC